GVPDEGVRAEGEDGGVDGDVLEADPPAGEPEREVEALGAVDGGGPEGAVVVEGEVLGLDGAVADALPGEPLPGQREVPASGISLRLNLRAGEGGEQQRHGEGAQGRPGAGSGHVTGALVASA